METLRAGTALAVGLALSGLSTSRSWLAYYALGGTNTRTELEAYMGGDGRWSPGQHDIAAQALNERCSDMGLGFPVAYARETE